MDFIHHVQTLLEGMRVMIFSASLLYLVSMKIESWDGAVRIWNLEDTRLT